MVVKIIEVKKNNFLKQNIFSIAFNKINKLDKLCIINKIIKCQGVVIGFNELKVEKK